MENPDPAPRSSSVPASPAGVNPTEATKPPPSVRAYRVYRVGLSGTDNEIETLLLEGTVRADDPDVAIRKTAEEKDPPVGTEYVAYPVRFEKRRKPRKKVEESWEFD